MSEEFDESEVIFSDNFFQRKEEDDDNKNENENEKENRPFDFRENSVRVRNKTRPSKSTTRRKPAAAFSSSVPVNIPKNMLQRFVGSEEDEEYSGMGGWRMTPPHVIVEERSQMAFSVCTGKGRTLKGRDLSRVRNSVLRLTGFLEA